MKVQYLVGLALVGVLGAGRPAFAGWWSIPGGATPTQPVGGSTGCSPKEGGDFRFSNLASAGFGLGPFNVGGTNKVAPGFALSLVECLSPQVLGAILSISPEELKQLPKDTKNLYREIQLVFGKIQKPLSEKGGFDPKTTVTPEGACSFADFTSGKCD